MIRCVRCSSCVVADYVAVGMMRTVLPFYAKKLGGGAVLIGSLEAVYGVGQVIGALTLGRLSDKKGRRFVLAISFFGSIIGYTMAGFATTPAMLLASRLPVGLAKQTVTIARAIVADCTAEGDRSKWMAWLVTATAIGYTIGPAAGGKLADEYGDSVPPAIAVGIFAILFPLVMSVLPETCPPALSKKEEDAPKPSVPAATFVLMAVLALPEFALVIQSSTGMSMFVMEHLERSKTFFGMINSTAAAGAAVLSGTILPLLLGKLQWSDRFMLLCSYLCMAVGSISLFMFPTVEALFVLMPLFCFAIAILRSSPAALISKAVTPQTQGSALGLLDFSASVCRIVAPLVAGSLVESTPGVLAPWALNSVLCTTGWGLLLVLGASLGVQNPKKGKGK